MEHNLELLRQAVEAVTITSPVSFNWFGKAADNLPRRLQGELPADKVRGFLTFALQGRLYEDFYCAGEPRATDAGAEKRAAFGRLDFVESLSQANQGEGGWDPSWTVARREGDILVVSRNGLSLKVEQANVRPADGQDLVAGATVQVRFPKELVGVSPGFYMAVGDQPLKESGTVLRLYFNLQAIVAAPFIKLMTSRLNAAGLGFKLKILNDDTLFQRCDAAVLYIQPEGFEAALPALREVYRDYGAYLGQRTPVFTKALARGVGVAESPVAKGPLEIESFGMNRCRLMAEGLIEAHEHKIADVEGRVAAIAARFSREGLSLDSPHLNPGSARDYAELGEVVRRAPEVPRRRPTKRAAAPDFLATAEAIGRSVVETAIWHDDRCTWIGAQPPEFAARNRLSGAVFSALGPDLYGGVAGVALFLGELARATGDSKIAATAIAAARQAAYLAEDVPGGDRIGLYSGWIGLALALTRTGASTDCLELIDRGAKLALAVPKLKHDDSESDLLAGRAGAIAGLLALHAQGGAPAHLELAQLLADELLGKALYDSAGRASWALRGQGRQRPLTGFSHGAAGIAYGLLKLYGIVPEARWREGALAAFAYEDAVYEATAENWPDFRQAAGGGRRQRSFATYWCHGAPGIALSRLLAARLLPEEDFAPAINAALRTTRRYLELGLQQRVAGFALCHGLAGNADILLVAAAAAADDEAAALARQVGEFGIEHYGSAGSWPCGIAGGGVNQSLMLGISGIGYFYLRLNDPGLASVLAI